MTFESKLVGVLGVFVVSGLALGACGDGDGGSNGGDGPGVERGGSGGDADEATGGVTSRGGSNTGGRTASTGGRTASTGGRAPAAGAAGEENTPTGGTTSATGGQPSTPSGDCETPAEPVEHCYAENDDRPGTATCSEYYTAGVALLFCTGPESGGCPRDGELAGACIGGVSSAYYYTDDANEGFWDAAEGGCEVNAGTWCSF